MGIDATLPALELEIDALSGFKAEIPMLVVDVSASGGTLRVIDINIPSLELSINGPSSVDMELPSLFLGMDGDTGKTASVSATLPSLTMSARTGAYASLVLPGLSMEVEASSGNAVVELTGDVAVSIPSLQMRATTKSDDVIDITLPSLTMSMDTAIVSGVSDDALRYVRGVVR